MRPWKNLLLSVTLTAVGLSACVPEASGPRTGNVLDAIAGLTPVVAGETQSAADVDQPSSGPGTPQRTTVSGSLSAHGDYRLFEFTGGLAGEQWAIGSSSGWPASGLIVVLFNGDQDLLQRQLMSSRSLLEHGLRHDQPTVYVGVALTSGSSGMNFQLDVTRQTGHSVPGPTPQVVWLNFGSGSNIRVHSHAAVSFAPFDGSMIGTAYAGQTEVMKAAIVAAMREDYAGYNVTIVTSDDGPPPAAPYASLHFGGDDDRLLGLADSVDQYNRDPGESALIFVSAFSDYSVMQLTPDEMGQMIGNVASHELGHLLGLYHTKVPTDIMDTTGTAWDLAADQGFFRADLEPSVFPVGYEDSPARLSDSVGGEGVEAAARAKAEGSQKALRKAHLRAMIREEVHHRCGNCDDPDG